MRIFFKFSLLVLFASSSIAQNQCRLTHRNIQIDSTLIQFIAYQQGAFERLSRDIEYNSIIGVGNIFNLSNRSKDLYKDFKHNTDEPNSIFDYSVYIEDSFSGIKEKTNSEVTTEAILNKNTGLTMEQAAVLFYRDLINAINTSYDFYPLMDSLSTPRKFVLIDMAFNLKNRMHSFKDFKNSLNENNIEKAVSDLKNSNWYEQTESRSKILVDMLKYNVVPNYKYVQNSSVEDLFLSNKFCDALDKYLSTSPTYIQFESHNYPDNIATVSYGRMRLERKNNITNEQVWDNIFEIVPGYFPGTKMFRSIRYPNHVLTINNQNLVIIAPLESNSLFKEKSSFYIESGFSEQNKKSIRLYNSQKYIRHSSAWLRLNDKSNSQLFNDDATWNFIYRTDLVGKEPKNVLHSSFGRTVDGNLPSIVSCISNHKFFALYSQIDANSNVINSHFKSRNEIEEAQHPAIKYTFYNSSDDPIASLSTERLTIKGKDLFKNYNQHEIRHKLEIPPNVMDKVKKASYYKVSCYDTKPSNSYIPEKCDQEPEVKTVTYKIDKPRSCDKIEVYYLYNGDTNEPCNTKGYIFRGILSNSNSEMKFDVKKGDILEIRIFEVGENLCFPNPTDNYWGGEYRSFSYYSNCADNLLINVKVPYPYCRN